MRPGYESAAIVDVRLAAGHDGAAELILLLRHSNGVASPLTLDAGAALDVMAHCGADRLEDLIGRSWRSVVEGRQSVTDPTGAQSADEHPRYLRGVANT
jgi:hypothetical protein